ncbi:MAG: hypothetical protein C0175_00915, partial [Caldisericum exile]
DVFKQAIELNLDGDSAGIGFLITPDTPYYLIEFGRVDYLLLNEFKSFFTILPNNRGMQILVKLNHKSSKLEPQFFIFTGHHYENFSIREFEDIDEAYAIISGEGNIQGELNSSYEGAEYTTTDIANKLIKIKIYKTLRDTEEILMYKEGIYVKGGETSIKEYVHNLLGGKESTQFVNEVIGKVSRGTYIDREIFSHNNDNEHKIVIRNGILNLDTLTLQPFSPDFYSLVKFPVKYDPDSKPGRIVDVLKQLMREEDLVVFQEWVGYNLWIFNYEAQKALMLVGEGGNGKSTALKFLVALLGKENVASKSLHELESDPHAMAYLFGKVANIYPDLPTKDIYSTGTFKMLTGGDRIESRKLYQAPFSFTNIAKLTFSANKIPKVPDDSTAFFRRWIIIEFPYVFEGTDKEIKGLADELIKDEDELSGFLNWALEGLQRLRNNGWHFSYNKSTEEIRNEYEMRSNQYLAFKENCLILDPSATETKDGIYQAFKEFCQMHKITVVSYQTFYKNFKYIFAPGEIEEVRLSGPKRPRGYKGIKIRPKDRWGLPIEDEDEELGIRYYRSEFSYDEKYFLDKGVEMIKKIQEGNVYDYVLKIPDDPSPLFNEFLKNARAINSSEFYGEDYSK